MMQNLTPTWKGVRLLPLALLLSSCVLAAVG